VSALLEAIDTTSDYDASACAEAWLTGSSLPSSSACP